MTVLIVVNAMAAFAASGICLGESIGENEPDTGARAFDRGLVLFALGCANVFLAVWVNQ